MNRVSILALALLLCAGTAFADGPETGVVNGTVVDASGSPLPGVGVTITGARGDKFVQTDENGQYRFALLQPGDRRGLVPGGLERADQLEATGGGGRGAARGLGFLAHGGILTRSWRAHAGVIAPRRVRLRVRTGHFILLRSNGLPNSARPPRSAHAPPERT